MKRALRMLAFLIAVLSQSAPVLACSVRPDYRVPTSLELAEEADVILLGTIEDGPPEITDLDDEPRLLVHPTLLLKGTDLPSPFQTIGMIARPEYAEASDPDELAEAHPQAYMGACIRFMYVKGSTVLFFLKERDGKLTLLVRPFARIAEDVSSPEARWVKAVRLYVGIAALPEAIRREALLASKVRLREQKDDADAQAIAEDIDRQLAWLK